MVKIIYIIVTLLIACITGSIIEANHFRKIKENEISMVGLPVVNYDMKKWDKNKKVKKIKLVTGEVVISGDYFKNFIASLRKIFGGRVTSFESIMDRARREAIMRMRQQAMNASIIVNVRIESIIINNPYLVSGIPRCTVIAYGTAVTYEK